MKNDFDAIFGNPQREPRKDLTLEEITKLTGGPIITNNNKLKNSKLNLSITCPIKGKIHYVFNGDTNECFDKALLFLKQNKEFLKAENSEVQKIKDLLKYAQIRQNVEEISNAIKEDVLDGATPPTNELFDKFFGPPMTHEELKLFTNDDNTLNDNIFDPDFLARHKRNKNKQNKEKKKKK